MKYQMIVSDVDGTLVDWSGNVADSVLTEIGLIRRAGFRFTVATGRRRPTALSAVQRLNLTDPVIAFDGAVIIDPASGECLHADLLKGDMLAAALEVLRQVPDLYVLVHDDPFVSDRIFVASEQVRTAMAAMYPTMEPELCVRSDLLSCDRTPRIVAFGPMPALKQANRKLAAWPGRVMFWSMPDLPVMECYAPGAHKGSGLRRLCEMMELDPQQVIAIGDDINDIPLLSACGLSIAMGNARPELIRLADMVCDDVERAGMLPVLQSLRTGELAHSPRRPRS